MKTTKNTFLFTLAIAFVLTATAFKRAQPKPDFSGTWVLNKEKSDFAGLPFEKAAASTIKISQKSDSIKTERTFEELPVSSETFGFAGEEVAKDLPEASVSRKLTWSKDGKSIVIASIYKMHRENEEPWEYTRTETYTLTEQGKTLTLDRVTVTPASTEKIKAVYNRQ